MSEFISGYILYQVKVFTQNKKKNYQDPLYNDVKAWVRLLFDMLIKHVE